MTTVPAANNAMPNVASAARRVAVHLRVALLKVPLQEAALRGVVLPLVRLRETVDVVAVVPPAMMTMIIIHRVAVAEAGGDTG